MTANFAQRFRSVAWLLLAAIATAGIGLFFGSSNSATANTYTYSNHNGTVANESTIKIHYIWATTGDRVSFGVEGPLGLEVVWTNLATSESFAVAIADRSTPSSTVSVQLQTPVNTWSAATKVQLEIRPRSGAGSWGLNGIINSANAASNLKMWEVLSLGNYSTLTRMTSAFQGASTSLRVAAALPSTVRDLSLAFASSTANPDITGWDVSQVTTMTGMFQNATAFNQNIGTWTTSATTNMRSMFAGAAAFNQELSSWDVSNVTNMSFMFEGAVRFNNSDTSQTGNPSNILAGTKPLLWTTSAVTDMSYMFRGAKSFNQNINSWDVSKVTNFKYMFAGGDTTTTTTEGVNPNDASIYFNNGGANDQSNGISGSAPLWSANPPGSGTGTASIDMSFMFSGAVFFNQNLNSWDTSYVTNMAQMFENAQGFNNGDQKYSSNNAGSHNFTWSTSRVTSFIAMFYNTYAFNQNVNSWDVSSATTFRYMFANTRANNTGAGCNCEFFNNGNLRGATTSNTMTWLASGSTALAVDMGYMFSNNPYFNQDISGWDVSKVTDFSNTFNGAIAFNNGQGAGGVGTKPLSWNTSAVTLMNNMFYGANSFNQNIDNWDTSKVAGFTGMFTSATGFNNGLASGVGGTMIWRTNPGVPASMGNMFNSATSFNQNISSWNTSAVTSMHYMFNSALKFNNGQPAGTAGGADLTFSTSNVTNMTYMFNNAAVFNQNVSSFDTSKVTDMSYMFSRSTAFNNGQAPGGAGQRPLRWTTSNVTTIANMFNATGASVFNQNVSGWDLSKCTNMNNAFQMVWPSWTNDFNNGALPGETNTLNWTLSTTSNITMTQTFQSLRHFNADISGWNTSRVTSLYLTFGFTGAFNQDISGWDTARVTSFQSTFRSAAAFNKDISNWNVSNATTLANMFDGAKAFNRNLAQFQLSSVANSGLAGIFGSDTTSAMTEQNIQDTTVAWSHQASRSNFPTTGTYDAFGKARWLNCAGYAAYVRMNSKQLMTTWATLGSAPTGCNTATVSWYGASTGSPTTQSIPAATANFTPETATSTTGVAPRYVVVDRGTTLCRVNNITGVINYTTAGNCRIRAYDVDPGTNGDITTYKDVTFTLPTPSSSSAPTAPTTISARASISALSVTFSAPVSNGGMPLTGYEVGYSLTQGGATTWVSVSPVVTSSPTLSFTLSGLVNGTSYWVKVRAINSIGASAASSEFGPVTPATTPSAPSIASSTISAGTVTLTLGAPGTNGGAAITSYEYRLATSSTAVLSASWTSSGTTSTTISVSGLVNGTSYFFQVRAVNSVGAGSATAVSSAITPITTTSPVVIYVSNKLGYSPLAEIQFFAPVDNGGSAILDYQIRMSTNEGATWTNWANQAVTYNVNTQRWYITLTNLDGTNLAPVYYTFEIRARNAAGFSATSLQVPSGAPITSVNFGNQQAVINFKAAKFDGNSPILGYEYKYVSGTIANPSTVSPWISISSTVWQNATTTSAVPLTVSGLVNGTPHTLWVRAVNAIGGNDQPYWDWTLNTGTPNKQLPTISFSYSVGTVAYSESASYSPTFSSNSLGDITFSTTTPTKCSVATFSGVVTGLNAGLCTIQLSQAESPTYSATTVLRYINTTMINQPTLQVSASATSSPYLGTVTLTSSGGAGVGAVTYTAVVGSACVVSGNVVTVGNAGSSCAVIATKASDGNYFSANSSQLSISTTRINQAALTFSNLAELPARSSMSVSAIGGSGDGVLRYRVSNAGTTGCSLNGTSLTATSAGQCTIEASRASSTNYTVSASVSQVIEIVKSAQTIRFTTNVPAQPLVGSTYSPSATASSGLSISFSVSGGGCSLTTGTITFTAAGDCKVEASQTGDGAYLAAPTASQTIAVGRRNHTLAFSTISQNITAKTFGDQAFVLTANSTEAEAQVAFTLSPQTTNDACSVFSSGLVLVLNVGDCVIEAYSTQTQALAAASTISKRIEIRADKASAPFITSVAMGNLSITAGFTPPSYIGGSSISAYTIVASDQTPNSTIEVSDSSCGTTLVNGQISCRISGLENGKSYKIKVAAINGAGEGEFSVLSPAITVATNPAAVQNLRVIQGANTLAISWDDPDSLGGGTFSSYRVYVKRSSTTSYDADHYFNVTNQNTRNITISAETPPDGMTHPGGPALVNGVAYDIKVVTVTTANTQELTGNTAVVNQIPRTVPEPPRLANALVVGNKLVLTWTAPLSDGGAAVTTYSASVGQSPCVFAAADDTYCEIALPTAPGNYDFSIVAQNVAGSSTELQGTYTVAAYNSPSQPSSGGSTGGSDVTEPAKPSETAPVISGIGFSADKKQIIIRGLHLKGIKKVVIGNLEAVIVSQTTEMIILRTPVLKAGSHAVFLHMTDNTVLRYAKELFVEGAKPATVVTKKLALSGFKPGSSVLTAQMKKDLLAIFKANRSSKSLQCIGHTQGPTILKSDARLAMKRANAVCDFAKRNGVKVVSGSYQNNKLVGAKFRRVDLVFTK
jgi:surface protein